MGESVPTGGELVPNAAGGVSSWVSGSGDTITITCGCCGGEGGDEGVVEGAASWLGTAFPAAGV